MMTFLKMDCCLFRSFFPVFSFIALKKKKKIQLLPNTVAFSPSTQEDTDVVTLHDICQIFSRTVSHLTLSAWFCKIQGYHLPTNYWNCFLCYLFLRIYSFQHLKLFLYTVDNFSHEWHLSFWQHDQNLEIPGKRNSHLRYRLHQIGPWTCLCGIFSVAGWRGRVQPTLSTVISEQAGQNLLRKHAE